MLTQHTRWDEHHRAEGRLMPPATVRPFFRLLQTSRKRTICRHTHLLHFLFLLLLLLIQISLFCPLCHSLCLPLSFSTLLPTPVKMTGEDMMVMIYCRCSIQRTEGQCRGQLNISRFSLRRYKASFPPAGLTSSSPLLISFTLSFFFLSSSP